VLSQM